VDVSPAPTAYGELPEPTPFAEMLARI